jgi:transcriptional regulator with XRE-family HTH domain
LIVIPNSFWQRTDTIAALRNRHIGEFFRLLRQYAGASQTQIGTACWMTQGKVSEIMRDMQKVETLAVFERIANGLEMPDAARMILGLAPQQAPSGSSVPTRAIPPGDEYSGLETIRVSDLLSLDPGDRQEEEDAVRRRTFVGLSGASIFSALFADSADSKPSVDAELLAPVLAAHTAGTAPPTSGAPPDIAALTAAVSNARHQYQACYYSELVRHLPGLLAQLHAACARFDGEARLHAYALSADAHHVAAGLLLKLDDQGLACLAADRSMHAAQASQDPLTAGASARIITHTLMNGGHLTAAVGTASTQATRLDQTVSSHTPESVSVYGSLLLRGAIAAAQDGNRSTRSRTAGRSGQRRETARRRRQLPWDSLRTD